MNWLIYALIGTLATSLAFLVEKKSLIKDHPLQFVTILSIFSVILSIFFYSQVNLNFPKSLLWVIYLNSIGWCFAGWYLAKAIRHTQLSSTTPLLNLTPAIIAILAFIFLRDVITTKQIFGISLLIVGTYILETHNKKNLFAPFKSLIKSKYSKYILSSIMIAAITAVLDKYILNFMTSFTYIFIIQIFMLINFLILMCYFQGGLKPIKIGLKNAGFWIFLLAVLTVSKRILIVEAISLTHVSLVVAIVHLSTLFTVILGGQIFHEKNLKRKIIASLIMLAGVYLIV